MPCERIEYGDRFAILCHRGKRWPRCSVPDCDRVAEFECDHPVSSHRSGTCDAKLCSAHAATAGWNGHHCPTHAQQLVLLLDGGA